MAKILQIIDVDSDGHKVRLNDGRTVSIPHGSDHPQVGEEFVDDPEFHEMPAVDQELLQREIDIAAELAGLRQKLSEKQEYIDALETEVADLVQYRDTHPGNSPLSEEVKAPTIEQLNSDAQTQAQTLSKVIKTDDASDQQQQTGE